MFDQAAEKVRQKSEAIRTKIHHFFETIADLIKNIFDIFLEFVLGLIRILIELWIGLFRIFKQLILFFIIFFPIPMFWLIGKELSSTFGLILEIMAAVFFLGALLVIGLMIKQKPGVQISTTQAKGRRGRFIIVLIFILFDIGLLLSPVLLFANKTPRNSFLRLLYSASRIISKRSSFYIHEFDVAPGTTFDTKIQVNNGDKIIFESKIPFYFQIRSMNGSFADPINVKLPTDTVTIAHSGTIQVVATEKRGHIKLKVISRHP